MAPAILSTSTLGHQYLCSGRFSLRQGLWAPTLSRTLKPSATSPARALPGVGRLPPRGRTSVVWASRAPAAAVENKVEERDVDGRQEKGRILRVGIICGGPSEERGISLNSARSVLDHIQGEDVHVYCYYIDINMNAYAISSAQLYSNTPADFDFKLESLAQGFPSLKEFTEHLASSVDIVFPVIHGRFGEDGGVQGLLEKASIPFVGTESKECEKAFDKYNASIELRKHGFVTVPNFLIKEGCVSELSKWFTDNQLDTISGKVVVKPSRAGSSIGVTIAYGVHDTLNKANNIMLKGIDDKVLVEIFLEGGSEFTAIVVDVGTASDCCPVTLLPTEVELQPYNNKAEDDIFNYRRKYLPTQQVAYHTPPRYPIEVIDYIRQGAAMLFQLFGLRDFARVDGWFLPSSASKLLPLENKKVFGDTKFGTIVFTDINLISGMEQTSFLFQQASKVGFSHSNVLRTITRHACSRFPSLLSFCNYSKIPEQQLQPAKAEKQYLEECHLQKVFVIFGGETSERQVSLMSGTNIWLNLQAFGDLDVIPCLLTPVDGYVSLSHRKGMPMQNSRTVWCLPYSLVLRHTTEEVYAACIEAIEPNRATITADLRSQVMDELLNGLSKHKWFGGFDIIDNFPMKFTLEEWIRKAKESQAVVFIAVHGGIGEDGTLQSLLESAGVPYTGPGILASKTCVDKVKTSLAVHHLADQGVLTIPKDVRSKENLINADALDLWHNITTCLKSKSVCVKPASDGCSTGVARLCSVDDLSIYVKALTECVPQISANTLSKAHGVIEMPSPPPEFLIFEPFIETDEITFSTKLENGNARKLIWKGCNEWVEVTVGIMGKRGMMHSLTPSVTVKESGDILSLEEKFQGGTGINLTPPPKTIVSEVALQRCKQRIEMIANALDLEGFSRIDAFINVHSGEVLVIEVNTVPGMTPSTVLIHQALAEEPPMYPHTFFRTALDLALQRTKCGSRLEVDGLRQ